MQPVCHPYRFLPPLPLRPTSPYPTRAFVRPHAGLLEPTLAPLFVRVAPAPPHPPHAQLLDPPASNCGATHSPSLNTGTLCVLTPDCWSRPWHRYSCVWRQLPRTHLAHRAASCSTAGPDPGTAIRACRAGDIPSLPLPVREHENIGRLHTGHQAFLNCAIMFVYSFSCP
jgi:hypothetical protein